MRLLRKLLTALLCVVMLFSAYSCADMGEGEHENSFHDYFSAVYLFATDGRYEKESIAKFNATIEKGDEKLEEVVPVSKYAYIAFKVAKGYTLRVEEFACHAKTDGAKETVYFDFYTSAFLPTQLKTEGGEFNFPDFSADDREEPTEGSSSSSNEEEEEEITEEDAVREENKFASLSMVLTGEWDSALLAFGAAQTVNPYEYIILRARNNCLLDWENLGFLKPTPVAFTVNYLMFRFTKVYKS